MLQMLKEKLEGVLVVENMAPSVSAHESMSENGAFTH